MTRHRTNGRDDFFVGDFVGRAGETGVAAIHQDGAVALGVAPQRGNELPSLRVVQRTEIHRRSPSRIKVQLTPARRRRLSTKESSAVASSSRRGGQFGKQQIDAAVHAIFLTV